MITAQYNADLSSGCPAYYLALNDTTKAALLCIRGTYSPEDMLTDLLASGVQFMDSGHSAHAGMVKAAQFLAKKFGGLLHALHDAGEEPKRSLDHIGTTQLNARVPHRCWRDFI